MAFRARLAAPVPEPRHDWPWHKVKWTSLASHLLWGGHRRLEAESYLASGFGLRRAIESRAAGWKRLKQLASISAPPRIKSVLVAPEFGAPYLNTSQVFAVQPQPRKWLSVEKTTKAESRFVANGDILVLASASVGRSTVTTRAHEGAIVSHHFMRVESQSPELRGWIYAFLRSPQARLMMSSAQYGGIIRHIEPSHLGAVPVPIVQERIAADFEDRTNKILELRNLAHRLSLEAENLFESTVGKIKRTESEAAFQVRASQLSTGRRRMEACYHTPVATAILRRFRAIKAEVFPLTDVTTNVWWMPRFKRFYGDDGIPYLSADELFTVNPDQSKRILVDDEDEHERYFVKQGWILMACSGQTYGLNGAACLATNHHSNTFFSHDLIRIIPKNDLIRAGYLLTTLTHPTLGRPLLIRAAYGTSIPHLDPGDVSVFPVVRVSAALENKIADLAEESAALRAQADVKERAMAEAAGRIIEHFVAGKQESFEITTAIDK